MTFSTICRKCSIHLLRAVENVQSKGMPIVFAAHRNVQHYSTDASGQENTEDDDITQRKLPLMVSRESKFPISYGSSRQAWIESMDSLEGSKVGMVDLHPDVFATFPRVDILHANMEWQKKYREIDYKFEQTRAEWRGTGKKPWPQKGTGRARHASIRSPLWRRGGAAHGPRGPLNRFYMLSTSARAEGLRIALTCKYNQNDLVIVDNLNIPSSDPEWLLDLTDVRYWGYSVLFVDDSDEMPENVALASEQTNGFTLMPAYGLNVYSMLKHDTLVMTLSALERVEGKLLEQLRHPQGDQKYINSLKPEDFQKAPKEDDRMYKQFTHPLDFDRDFHYKPQFMSEREEQQDPES